MAVENTTSTTIKICIKINFWGLKINFEVKWKITNSARYSTSINGSTTIDGSTSNNGSISYIITGLEEDSNYTITVTAISEVGSAIGVSVTGRTMKAGELYTYILSNRIIMKGITFFLF